jgi:hypothetical protein
MDSVVLREKDEWGRLSKESVTLTPTDYGAAAAEYALTVLIPSPLFFLNPPSDSRVLDLESRYERACGRDVHGVSDVLHAGEPTGYDWIDINY